MAETAVVARLKAVLTGDSAGLRRDLDQSEKRLQKFADNATRVGRTMTTRLTLPLVGVGVAAVKTASDFEQSMTKITALVGVAANEVRAMEGQVRSMAVQFGKSGKEAADALFFITSAGLRGSTATDTLAASLKASAIGLGDTATIADLATSALNAYGADTISASQATDVLTAAVREGKLEASELAGSMGRVLPLSSAMGVSFNEVGAAFAALSRTGTNAAEAATQIRGILASLLRPTKQSEEAMAGLGLSAEGLRTQIREEGLLSTLGTLADKFAGNEAAAAAVFGNIRALSGVLDLMGANVATTEAIFASMADTTGTVDEAFAVVSETAAFQFQQAMAELKDSLLTLGQEAMPIVRDAVEILVGAIRGITDTFANMSDSSKQIVVALAGIAAVAGPVALGVGLISKAFIALRAANPWVLALTTAMTGLGIAFGAYYSNAKEAKDRQESLTQAFRDAGDPATVVTDRLTAIADSMGLISAAEPEAEADFSKFMADVVLQSEIAKNEVTAAFQSLGDDSRDAIERFVDQGGDAFNEFITGANDVETVLANIEDAALFGEGAVQEFALDLLNAGDIANMTFDELLGVIDAIQDTATAQKDHLADVEATNRAYIESGQIFEDYGDILGDKVVAGYVAAAEETGDYTGELLKLEDSLGYLIAELGIAEGHTRDLESAQASLAAMTAANVGTIDEMGMALLSAGEIVGYDIEQIQALVTSLGILDQLSPEVRVALGLEIEGGQQILGLIDQLLNMQMRQFSGRLGPEFFEQNPAIQGLIDLRAALAAALKDPTSVTGGGGGGGGSGASNAIDEVARAAEEAQRQLDALSMSVANLGDSLVSQDFRNDLFGASPDEIADIFENIVEQMDSLGMITADTAPQIAAIGEKFKAAASAAQELAEATQALADAEDELERRKQVVADLKDDYADFRKEFGVTGGQYKIALKKTPLEIALDNLEDAMPRLRDAQSNLENIKNQQSQYQTTVADMFKPQLSADTGVIGQTAKVLKQAREFRDNLIKLRDKGFPPDVIAEVVNAGLAGGAKLGRHLLRMGTGDMQEFLAMRAEIAQIGAQSSKIAADVVFGADVSDAQTEFDKQRSLVDQLFKKAIAAAADEAKKQETVVNGLKSALEAATAQMQTLVSNIQVELFNAFTNFLNKLDGQVKTLTGSPFNLTWDNSAINRLTNLISKVTDTPAPEQPNTGGGGSSGGGGSTPAPTPAPTMPTYTVVSGDGPIAIIKKLTGSTSGWSSKAKKLWQENGMWWKDNNNWQAIHAGQVLNVPALAKGGRARKGMPHLVGEMGAELFVPDSSGYVVPNHMLGGGGNQTVNVTINTHPGMRAEDIVREIEKYTRRRGAVAIPTVGNRRR